MVRLSEGGAWLIRGEQIVEDSARAEDEIRSLTGKSMTKEEAAFGANFSRFINERNVLKITEELNNAAIDIAGNGNAKIVLFDMAVRMIILLKA